jgi:hypothetical protein
MGRLNRLLEGATTLGIMTLNMTIKMRHSMLMLGVTLRIVISAECHIKVHYAEFCFAEGRYTECH